MMSGKGKGGALMKAMRGMKGMKMPEDMPSDGEMPDLSALMGGGFPGGGFPGLPGMGGAKPKKGPGMSSMGGFGGLFKRR